MIYCFESPCSNPYVNLAYESYFFNDIELSEEDYLLYFWSNSPSVIIGRNQKGQCECNLSLLDVEGIHLVRRTTGGGAVYHDEGNLNVTLVGRKDSINWTGLVQKSLYLLGVSAEISGRNDLIVDGRKISGCAFESKNERYLQHGCIMVDVKKDNLKKYLKPNISKLQKNGIKSVESRVMNLREAYEDITKRQIVDSIVETISNCYRDSNIRYLTEKEIDSEIIKKYVLFFEDEKWIYDDNSKADIVMSIKLSDADADIVLSLQGEVVSDVNVVTDTLNIKFITDLKKFMKSRLLSDLMKNDYWKINFYGYKDLTISEKEVIERIIEGMQ